MQSNLFNRLVFIVTFTCAVFANAEEPGNTPIQFQRFNPQEKSNESLCLHSQGYNTNIVLSECNVDDKTGTEFLLINTSNGYFTIQPAGNRDYCLRTFMGSQDIRSGHCELAANTSANYPSMHEWVLIKVDDHYKLQNKYKADAGSMFSCIVTREQSNVVSLGECTVEGINTASNNVFILKGMQGNK